MHRRALSAVAIALVLISRAAGAGQATRQSGRSREQMVQRIADAIPKQATVRPARPRRLLVYTKCKGFVHKAIPTGSDALRLMGERTRAFTVVITDDEADLAPGKLRGFDAVCLNNTTSRGVPKEQVKALSDYVSAGGGLVGIHAATDGDFGELFSALFSGHPWHEKVGVKVDDPGHPLCRAFGEKGFWVTDEIYQFARGKYSREGLRVLLSLDMAKTRTKPNCRRKDNDYGVAWVKTLGRGRVFYCSLGHRDEIFWNPAVLQFYLDGIQFALGDYKVDTTPSASLSPAPRPALVP